MNTLSILSLLVFLALDIAPAPPTDLPDAIFKRPRISGGRTTGAYSVRFAVVGKVIYVADGPLGLQIYDASDPDKPRLIGAFRTDSDALAVSVGGTTAWVSTPRGAVLLDVSDPTQPKAVDLHRFQDNLEAKGGDSQLVQASSERQSDGQPALIAVVGDRAYISRDDGVVVIPMHSFKLPSLPSIASMRGADPVSTEAWRPNVVHLRTSGLPAQDVSVATATASSTATVTLVISGDKARVPEQPLVAPNYISPPILLTGEADSGVFRLLVSGPSGQKVRIQRSWSLSNGWEDWQAVSLGDAPVELTDEEVAADQVFYRAVSP